MLQEGSRYDGLAKEVVEERAERMINKLDESCKLAMQAEGMHEEPCKVSSLLLRACSLVASRQVSV
jgi:hypothetical protein